MVSQMPKFKKTAFALAVLDMIDMDVSVYSVEAYLEGDEQIVSVVVDKCRELDAIEAFRDNEIYDIDVSGSEYGNDIVKVNAKVK